MGLDVKESINSHLLFINIERESRSHVFPDQVLAFFYIGIPFLNIIIYMRTRIDIARQAHLKVSGFSISHNRNPALPVFIALHDPHVKDWDFDQREILTELDDALTDSDCLVLVTKHHEYLDLDLSHLKKIMRTPAIVDGRNVFDQEAVEAKGFVYRAIGKSGIARY